LLPYIIAMFLVVIAIVLVSYFAQARNNNEQISEYNHQHRIRYDDYESRLDELEDRIEALEKQTN
ncbi:MAG: hypothetical protein GXY26_01775, partial [Clostridiales bacterium]|nr:hypothetical protein [Clostridiales bacterium]